MPKFITLTPIWTGNIDKKSPILKESGLIGSLRSWYETIIRGYGGIACDPTSDDQCPQKIKGIERHCDVCELFGCTGWAKKIRLIVFGGREFKEGEIRIKLPGQKFGWLLGSGIMGVIDSNIKVLRINLGLLETEKEIKNTIWVIMNFMSKWSAIGARHQVGYGVFLFKNETNVDAFTSYIDKILKRSERREALYQTNLPDITEFFFCKINFTKDFPKRWNEIFRDVILKDKESLEKCYQNNFLPISPLVRYKLRQLFREEFLNLDERERRMLRHFLLGTVRGVRTASKISVSHAYKINNSWELRIWGWIPPNLPKIKRNIVLKMLYDAFKENKFWEETFKISIVDTESLIWREFDGGKRCTNCLYSGYCPGLDRKEKMNSFLKCLLETDNV